MHNQVQTRLHYLDAVRAFALLLGLVFHTSLSFMPIYIGWAVMDINTSQAVAPFVLISHSFRMALFFMIAGYFSRMTLHKKRLSAFIKSRIVKIAVPLLIAWFLLRPLLVSAWIIGGESMRGEADILSGLKAGFVSLSELPANFLIGTHLWFLYYLLLITFSVVVLRTLFNQQARIKTLLESKVDEVIGFVSKSGWSPLLLATPTLSILWFMQNWGIDTPDKSLVPVVPVFLLYGGCFLFGWCLQRNQVYILNLSRLSGPKFLLCFGSIISAIFLSKFEMNIAHAQFTILKTAFFFAYGIMMWALIILTLGIFKKVYSKPRKMVRYLADASYWIYLIHLPLVIYSQILFAELQLHWLIKFLLIIFLTVGTSLLLYESMVRKTIVGKVLNGSLEHHK